MTKLITTLAIEDTDYVRWQQAAALLGVSLGLFVTALCNAAAETIINPDLRYAVNKRTSEYVEEQPPS